MNMENFKSNWFCQQKCASTILMPVYGIMPIHWHCILLHYLRALSCGKRRRKAWANTVDYRNRLYRFQCPIHTRSSSAKRLRKGSVKRQCALRVVTISTVSRFAAKFPQQSGAKIMQKLTMPMNWHDTVYWHQYCIRTFFAGKIKIRLI